jgi:hypothetical protein
LKSPASKRGEDKRFVFLLTMKHQCLL